MPLYGPRCIYIYISLVPPRNFRDVHGDDFIRLRWFYGAGCSRKREIRPRELSKTCSFIFFFFSTSSNERMRFIYAYIWIIREIDFSRSMYELWNFRIIVIIVILFLWSDALSLFDSIQIYVTKIGEIQSYNVSKLIKIKSRIPLLFHYYSRLNSYKILNSYLIS